jgi:hypothetical protein
MGDISRTARFRVLESHKNKKIPFITHTHLVHTRDNSLTLGNMLFCCRD